LIEPVEHLTNLYRASRLLKYHLHTLAPLLRFGQPLPPSSTPFPYTTLFRSKVTGAATLTRWQHFYPQRPPSRAVISEWHRLHKADRKSIRLNSSHVSISYAVFCLKKKRQALRVVS